MSVVDSLKDALDDLRRRNRAAMQRPPAATYLADVESLVLSPERVAEFIVGKWSQIVQQAGGELTAMPSPSNGTVTTLKLVLPHNRVPEDVVQQPGLEWHKIEEGGWLQ